MTHRARLANEAWEALFRAQATLAREFELAGDWGECLPREYGVLYALSSAPDGLRITDLIDDVLLTQAGVSRLVSRLVSRGLVGRRTDPADGRASRIVLTEQGRATQRRLGRAHARHVRTAMTRALTPDQMWVLRDLANALLAAAPTQPSPPQRPSVRGDERLRRPPRNTCAVMLLDEVIGTSTQDTARNR